MNRAFGGGIPLFRLFGIQVFLHWSWFLVAMIELRNPPNTYSSALGNVAEYLALFGIVTMHEFGHALACRSVGGKADRILLWPLGGVAFVSPPQRPGAVLWSIVAGPLVNVILTPILYLLLKAHIAPIGSDANTLLRSVFWINAGLLIFNCLPIYPLDGGQILRALLWFGMGAGHSLRVATVIGMIGAIGGLGFALWSGDRWLVVLAAFAGWQCWIGFQYANALLRQQRMFHVEPPVP